MNTQPNPTLRIAITGGFNLQAAWSMGYVVGQNIVR